MRKVDHRCADGTQGVLMLPTKPQLRNVRPHRRIETAMNERDCRQNIERILLDDVPMSICLVRSRISKSAKQADDQIH
jgi:hypothetical protein